MVTRLLTLAGALILLAAAPAQAAIFNDFRRKRTVLGRAGKSYLARAPR